MQQLGPALPCDFADLISEWNRPLLVPKSSIKRGNALHWSYDIQGYKQISQISTAWRQSTFWHKALDHMVREVRKEFRDMGMTIGIPRGMSRPSHIPKGLLTFHARFKGERHASLLTMRQPAEGHLRLYRLMIPALQDPNVVQRQIPITPFPGDDYRYAVLRRLVANNRALPY